MRANHFASEMWLQLNTFYLMVNSGSIERQVVLNHRTILYRSQTGKSSVHRDHGCDHDAMAKDGIFVDWHG